MPGWRFLAAVGLLALTVSGTRVEAQEMASGASGRAAGYRFEASIMAGYRFLGELTSEGEGLFQSADLSNTPTWGVTLGYSRSPRFAFELQYSYARTEATWIPRNPTMPRYQSEFGIHDLQLAVLFRESLGGPDLISYAGLGAGATIFDMTKAVGDTTKFSFSVSLGVVKYLSGNVGLRFEGRWIPAYLQTTGSEGLSLGCESDAICFGSGVVFMQQFEFRGGATFRL